MSFFDPRTWFRRETKASAAGHIISAWNVGLPAWTPREYEQLADEAFVKNAIAYRCTKLIASNAATVPWLAYGAGDKELGKDHPLLKLLSRPGSMQGGAALFEALYAYLILSGNGYMEAVGPQNGAPRELWVHRPDRMKVVPGRFGLPEAYQYEAFGQRKEWRVNPLTGDGPILHVKEFHPINDWYGLSRVEPGAYGIDRNNAAAAHNKALLDNGARPSGALVFKPVELADKSKVTAPEAAIKAAEAELTARHGGPANAGKPIVLGGNVDWLDMGITPRDMDFGQGKDDSARDICAAFGVPHVLVVKGEATYNNLAQAKLDLYEETILPLVDRVVDALNAWLAPKFGDDIRLSVDLDEIPALEPRRESKRTTVINLLDKGVIDADEARDALQYEPRPKGSIGKVDATILRELREGMETIGPEPLLAYLKSVGLYDKTMTAEQMLSAADAMIEDDDLTDAVLPPAKTDEESDDEDA